MNTKTFDLQYWIGKKLDSTILFNKSYGEIKARVNFLKDTGNYKLGKFVIRPN